MRIGFVSIIRESWGGSEELWAATASHLLANQNEVIISALNTGSVSEKFQHLVNKGANLIFRRGFIQPGLSFNNRVPRKILLFLVNKILNPYNSFFAAKPDVIVYTGACDSLKNDPLFLKLLYRKNIPLIIINQVHYEYMKTFDHHEAEVLKKAFHYAKRNLFVSQRNKDVMERFLAEEIPNSIVVRNPVNLQSVEVLPMPSNEQVQFAMVANLLINHKGQDIVFDVLRKDKWKNRDWHLNIYGSGLDETYLKELSNFYDLGSRITFRGKVKDIRKVWTDNHILLMPSRVEGMPLAVVEAMLCARPVVATDVAGHMEWITEGTEGFIAEGANVYSFDQAMERAWNNRNKWELLGRNAHGKALAMYDKDPGKTLAEIIVSAVAK